MAIQDITRNKYPYRFYMLDIKQLQYKKKNLCLVKNKNIIILLFLLILKYTKLTKILKKFYKKI